MKSCVDGQNHLLWLTRGDADGRCRPLCMHSAVVQTELSFIWSSTICESHSFVSHSLRPHRLYSPWNSPGQNTGEGRLSLLQGIFPAQGSNPGLPQCRWILNQLSHRGMWKLSWLINENCTAYVLYLILKLRSLVLTFLIVLPPFSFSKGRII